MVSGGHLLPTWLAEDIVPDVSEGISGGDWLRLWRSPPGSVQLPEAPLGSIPEDSHSWISAVVQHEDGRRGFVYDEWEAVQTRTVLIIDNDGAPDFVCLNRNGADFGSLGWFWYSPADRKWYSLGDKESGISFS